MLVRQVGTKACPLVYFMTRAKDVRPGMSLQMSGGEHEDEIMEVQTITQKGGTCHLLLKRGMFYVDLFCDVNQEVQVVRSEQGCFDRSEEDSV